jgi:hypothetical protein
LPFFKLLIDPFNKAVLFAASLKPVAAAAELKHSPFISALSQVNELTRELLAEFPGVLPVPGKHSTPSHGVEHVIETSGRPVCAKVRRLDPDKLRCAREEFSKLEAAGIIRRSSSSGRPHCTWSRRKTEPGGPVGTTGGSIFKQGMIVTLFPIFGILLQIWLIANFFQKLIWLKGTIRFPWPLKMSQKQQF